MSTRSIDGYLKLPYARIITPDAQSGLFSAMILEFRGCFAVGKTPKEAYEQLEEAAESWLASCMESGFPIPEPIVIQESEMSAQQLGDFVDDVWIKFLASQGVPGVHGFAAGTPDNSGAKLWSTLDAAYQMDA